MLFIIKIIFLLFIQYESYILASTDQIKYPNI